MAKKLTLARPTEYEYQVLFDNGEFAEAATIAYKYYERLREESEKWLDLSAAAQLEDTLSIATKR